MAQTHRVLGQVAPTSTDVMTLYTVPAATQTIISSIVVAHRSAAGATTYFIAVCPAGAAVAAHHWLAFNVPITASETTVLKFGLTMAATDVLRVQTGSVDITFSAFGVEIT